MDEIKVDVFCIELGERLVKSGLDVLRSVEEVPELVSAINHILRCTFGVYGLPSMSPRCPHEEYRSP
jgi:hypothetical protein